MYITGAIISLVIIFVIVDWFNDKDNHNNGNKTCSHNPFLFI